jgi:hypothetical protein
VSAYGRFPRALLSATAVVTAVAACGGSSQPRLTESQFRARANAICAQANHQVEALPSEYNNPSDQSTAAAAISATQPIAQDLVRKLSALSPPASDENLWNQFLSRARTDTNELAVLRKDLESGNTKAAQHDLDVTNAASTDPLAQDLGLSTCAQNAQPSG